MAPWAQGERILGSISDVYYQQRDGAKRNSLISYRICSGGGRRLAASRRESPNRLAMSIMGTGGVSCAKLSHGERKNSLTSSTHLSHALRKKKKRPGLISDVCQGHIRGERQEGKSAGPISNVCLECRRGTFLQGIVWKQSSGSGKNRLSSRA